MGIMILKSLKACLKRKLPVEAAWDTSIYRYCYQRIVNRNTYDATATMREFYKRLICECRISKNIWFDVGANVGERTGVFARFASKVVACEPDPVNVKVLRRR